MIDPGWHPITMDPMWMQYANPCDSVRDLTLEAAQSASKLFKSGSSSRNIPFAKLKGLLDSRSDKDILDGLRKVVSVWFNPLVLAECLLNVRR